MKKVLLLLVLFTTFMRLDSKAQTVRYLDTTFAAVKVDSNVVYGVNWTILGLILQQTNRTIKQPLTMNVHTPVGDTVTKRPLVLCFGSGNFLPQALTQNYSGRKEDSIVSTLCRQFAHRGYVAASCAYRIGWNPTDPNQDNRTSLLINAAYRGVQDANTAIRYFKANAALWGIDTNRILLVGNGTGGYITLGAAAFDVYSKTVTTAYPANKFFNSTTGLPMIIEKAPGFGYINSDPEAKNIGTVPPGGSGTPPAGDTLCAANWITPSSKFQMCVNLGGALGDLTWLDANTPPIVSFQFPDDQSAPYIDATLRVPISPTTSLPVVRVQGAGLFQRRMDTLGRNNVFKQNIIAKYNPYKSIFDVRNGGVTGLFPIYGDTISDASPWDFVGPNDPYASSILVGAPRSSRARALRYIDTIMKVITPRACLALNLPCKGAVTSTEDLLNAASTKLIVSPNPAKSGVVFESEVYNPMQAIQVFDMSGRLVLQAEKVNSHFYTLQRSGLPTGIYIAKVKFEGGILTKKIVFED